MARHRVGQTRRMTQRNELLVDWGRGWAASRGTSEPRPLGDGAWGIEVGLLVATEDGRALYTSLGWRVESLMTAANIGEPA